MNNKELIEQWAHRYRARIEKEAEEERKKKEQEELEKAKNKGKKPKKEILLPQSPEFKSVSFLEGDFGKQINEKVQAKYGSFEAINKIAYDDKNKLIKGSNPFYVTAVNEIFREFFPDKNLRTATQADLERILKENSPELKGQYEDSSLVLRTKQEPNKYLAQDLFAQFKAKGITLKEDSAYVLPLFTLKLRNDEKSNYKLSFDITDSTIENYFEAPILMSASGNYINPAEMNDKTGLPNKVYEKSISGNRRLWTRNSGLVGLCLVVCPYIVSGSEGLAYSDAVGRVVVVSAEGTAPNFSANKP